ncbi:MAG TPA: sigma-70 family RNA polymerase sigma factor [Pseudonocardiaceae bacterium]
MTALPQDHALLLRELHDRHAPALWRYAVRLTSDPQLAEDVVQETLLRAWRRPSILEQDEAASRAWLFTVLRNLITDDRRSARVHRELASGADLPDHSIADRTDAMLDSWLVTDALAQLSEDHRAVIVLAYYGRRSVADIAATLRLPPGTVKSRLHYGLRALRLALQERGVTRE